MVQGAGCHVRVEGFGFSVQGLGFTISNAEQGRNTLQVKPLPEKQLKSRPESGLDWLQCAEFHVEPLIIYELSSRKFDTQDDLY